MAGHAEDALGSACIAQVLNLPLAIPAPEAVGAKGLVAGQDGEVFDLVPAVVAAIGAVVADQGAVSEQQQVGVRVEQGAARVAAEAVNVPSVSRCAMSVQCASSETRSGAVQCSAVDCMRQSEAQGPAGASAPSSKALPSSRIWGSY
jgi:hypothetical protein